MLSRVQLWDSSGERGMSHLRGQSGSLTPARFESPPSVRLLRSLLGCVSGCPMKGPTVAVKSLQTDGHLGLSGWDTVPCGAVPAARLLVMVGCIPGLGQKGTEGPRGHLSGPKGEHSTGSPALSLHRPVTPKEHARGGSRRLPRVGIGSPACKVALGSAACDGQTQNRETQVLFLLRLPVFHSLTPQSCRLRRGTRMPCGRHTKSVQLVH